jgi:heptosyltransferase-2
LRLKGHLKKILVISLPGIGDTVNCTPLFKPLRAAFPDARIVALVMYRPCREVLETNPCIDEVLLWEFLKEGTIASLSFLSALRKRKFDLSIMCFPANRREYNIVSFAVGAKTRLAHQYCHQNVQNLFFLNNRTALERNDLHNVEENLRLLELIGIHTPEDQRQLSLPLEKNDRVFASKLLENLPPHRFLIGMHAWSTTLKNMHRKCWPAGSFALLANRLKSEYDCEILLFQGPHDLSINRKIVDQSGVRLHLVDKTTVRQSAAIMDRCDLFITNDSGPMHIAAATGTRIVALFGPTDPLRLHPWTENYRIVRTGIDCSPCFYYSPKPLECGRADYACLTQLSVEKVYEAVTEELGRIDEKAGEQRGDSARSF